MTPAKRKADTVLVEIPKGDAEVWASFALKTDSRYTRLTQACKQALTQDKP